MSATLKPCWLGLATEVTKMEIILGVALVALLLKAPKILLG